MYTIKDDNANNDDIGNETISDSSIQDIEEDDLMRNLTKDKDRDRNRAKSNDKDKDKEAEDKQSYDLGRWTPNEHFLFLEALVKYGNEWKQIQEHIKTRSSAQARSHAQKYFIRLKKEFREITDVNLIKQKIQQKFQYELQGSFTPKNINNFLDIMIKLIYIREENITNYPFTTIQRIKMGSSNKQMGEMGVLQRKKRNKNKKMMMNGINNISSNSNNNKQSQYRKTEEKNIFKIERNLKRKQSIEVEMNMNMGMKNKNTNYSSNNNNYNNKSSSNKKNRAKCHMSNIKKKMPNLNLNLNANPNNNGNGNCNANANINVNPPCINFFTFNMIDNSTNNYLNTNLKHIGSTTSITMPMNQMGFPPMEDIRDRDREGDLNINGDRDIEAELGNTFRLETKETKNNPFFIQFDPEENRDGLNDNLNQDNNFNDYFPF